MVYLGEKAIIKGCILNYFYQPALAGQARIWNASMIKCVAVFFAKILISLIPLLLIDGSSIYAQKSQKNENLIIQEIELGYPCPSIPYYHLKAKLQLPHPSIMEIEVSVNGKVLRATDLRRSDDAEDINRPPLSERPPSGYGVAQDGTKYKNANVIGWVKWQPGENYDITISVRMKKTLHSAKDDIILTGSRMIRGPEAIKVFNKEWKSYKSVVVSETAGIDRINDPVEVLLAFYPDEAHDLKRELRVVAVDPITFALTEVTSQVYDIQKYLKEDDLAPDANGKPTRNIPLWMPTVTARVAFAAQVLSKSSRVFLIYYNNENASDKLYETDLRVQGEAPGLQIDNNQFTVVLNPNSGHVDQITLKSKPDAPLFHRMETNGAIHWNPDIYVPPQAWTHTSDWDPPPNIKSFSGPVVAKSEVWGDLPGVPEVDASVRYEFYPGVSYFISSTSMRINKTVNCLSLRNAEVVFKRELITHASWYDVLRDTIITYDVRDMPDLTDLKMEADVPWITFYNEETGIGFAGIQLSYSNSGLESDPRLLNPFFYITAGPWIYWARGLSHSYLSSNMQQVIPAMKGSLFSEKWAYLIYKIDKGISPFPTIIALHKQLTHPLRLQLVEEVDDRVSKSLQEVFMDNGKSGWEGRKTKKQE